MAGCPRTGDFRQLLLTPLFKLLKAIVGGGWPQIGVDKELLPDVNVAKGDASLQAAVTLNAKHLIFMILDRIVSSLANEVTQQKVNVWNL